MTNTKTLESMPQHAFSQFELTQKLLNNLSQFNITPTAKLVLLYLSSCYNPKKADMFPKQKTMADKLGVSEASVIRAIQELHKEALIISERKYTNRYVFTPNFLISLGILDKNMQVDNFQNGSKETCNLQPVLIEPKREQNKKQNYFKNLPFLDPKRYKTGELKRLQAINNEEIKQVDSDYFQRVRNQINPPSRSPKGEAG